ncbi:MAG: LysR family transcriptional regulator [Sneathiella sp.]|nr:LysR family transcriptional regulator [Sneathiella sp.]
MLRNFDLNLFVVFEVIYDTGNLTQAAQALNKTQPAISNALARLRQSVGDPLFVNSGKRMNPTARADELIGPVRKALQLFQNNLRQDEAFDPKEIRKTIKLSVGDIGETIFLPRLIGLLREKAPNINLQIFQLNRRTIPRKLATNEIDFAVDIPIPVDDSLRQMPLLSDVQVVALSKEHPLARKENLSLKEYLRADHIHVSYRRTGGGVADLGLNHMGMSRNIVVRLQHHQAAFALLKQTNMILSAPSNLAKLHDCKVFDLPFQAPNLDMNLYWHKSADKTALNIWFRSGLSKLIGDLNVGNRAGD